MDNEWYEEKNIELLGNLRNRLHRLEETDYMIAYYKGYSASGMTFEEIKEEIESLTDTIRELENRIEDEY
ncbi:MULTISPECIES: hypothetical protein [unclassified Enterococcus]|uniref:hypothetical protein n=1 Tax=unclassified Enterococcus TaxID=2608891 RepID=UPI0013EB401E|nr:MULTISPECIES: hypothetical protein [unclassified Enterococcus]